MLSRNILNTISEYPTPYYLYDLDLLRRTLDTLRTEADKYGYKIHYALKANFEDRITDIIASYGLGADCVSGNEVRYAVEKGFGPAGIVFAGVGKSDSEIEYAVTEGIFAFNCESRQELEVIDSIARRLGKTADVALRINPDVDPRTHRHISTGQGDSKFGISYKEIEEVAAQLGELKNIRITGLHFHIGSQITEPKVFEYLSRRVNTLYDWFTDHGFNFTHLNLGGGLGIDYADPEGNPIPDFASYFDIFKRNLRIHPAVEIHFELGRSVVGQCAEMISRVMFVKTTSAGNKVAILDSSMTQLARPALYNAVHNIENLSAGADREHDSFTIAGTVCESTDTFVRDYRLPELRRGDLVSIKSAGAYGTSMASRYNMHDLPKSVYSDDII